MPCEEKQSFTKIENCDQKVFQTSLKSLLIFFSSLGSAMVILFLKSNPIGQCIGSTS